MSGHRRAMLQRDAERLADHARRVHAIADATDPAEDDASAIRKAAEVWERRAERVRHWADAA